MIFSLEIQIWAKKKSIKCDIIQLKMLIFLASFPGKLLKNLIEGSSIEVLKGTGGQTVGSKGN